MSDEWSLTVSDGKYKVIFDGRGLRALRYGEEWRSLVGDNLVMGLCHKVMELQDKLASQSGAAPSPREPDTESLLACIEGAALEQMREWKLDRFVYADSYARRIAQKAVDAWIGAPNEEVKK